ncbi:type II toxin-antitoxin system Phd/YefM family antitoxin [Nocardia abscessus]|uniref:type II toxin-antitoxin system Phd/YefM family antitoxin n=1 Tax=Nocardia abscessus TaxID=120957 RepID=UPI001895AA2D|nr:type II toxin-antitoxin system Phd/YefM family antitoxin [Nocardia abscessus]MBF6473843.1 type II toxin-antitoxin system Phd/YefM family antitoxin [Nocardia abscessus]
MPALPISNVRQNLFGLVQQVNDDHDPLTVVTKSGQNAVLVAESDWNSLMETLYVLQTHGGVHLLKSAQDAREGRTQAHTLIEPDAETSEEEWPPFEDMTDELKALASKVASLREQFAALPVPEAPAAAGLVDELRQFVVHIAHVSARPPLLMYHPAPAEEAQHEDLPDMPDMPAPVRAVSGEPRRRA